jgi:hypothetical protein
MQEKFMKIKKIAVAALAFCCAGAAFAGAAVKAPKAAKPVKFYEVKRVLVAP